MIPSEREKYLYEYITMETTTLKKLKKPKLFEIIYRFDNEVIYLQKELKYLKEELKTKEIEFEELKDQLAFLKDTNQLLSSEFLVSNTSVTVLKKKLDLALIELKKYTNIDNDIFNLQEEVTADATDKLTESLFKTKEKLKIQEGENASLKDIIKELRDSKKNTEFELIALQDTLFKKNLAFKEAIDAANAKNIKKKDKITELRAEISSIESKLLKCNKKYQTEISKIYKDHSYLQTQVESYKIKIKHLRENSIMKETFKLLSLQYEDLTAKHAETLQENRSLSNKLAEIMKQNHYSKPELSTINYDNTKNKLIQRVYSIKSQLDKIYKDLIGHISKTIQNSQFFYNIEPDMYYSIDKQLNGAIYDLYEAIEEYENADRKLIDDLQLDGTSLSKFSLYDLEEDNTLASSSRIATHNN